MCRSTSFKLGYITPISWVISYSYTRWAPTSYKWSYNPYKWPYNWVTGVITPKVEFPPFPIYKMLLVLCGDWVDPEVLLITVPLHHHR